MAFQNSVDPILRIVDGYFKKQRMLKSNVSMSSKNVSMSNSYGISYDLPEVPVYLIRDSKKRVIRAVYGNVNLLMENKESDVVIWSEEIMRDETGKVTGIKTTYPDGDEVINKLNRNGEKVVSFV